ncbi:MAG: FIVAR domain-containing protein [Lachnospiraceae bacterium]|nr:FIVAR domain-containing protein [Lachnospiraceae bacterium]
MKKRKVFKRALAVTVSAAMVAGSGISALAADYNFEPPTSPMEVDDNIITASVHRAGSVLPEILGMNTCCGFSMINGSMPTSLEEAKTKLMLGVFGTDANDSPDPYYYNYFYNFYAEENGLELSEDAVIIPENNVAASPAKADTTIIDEYGTSISLAGRPDVLIGVSSSNSAGDLDGYDELIQAIRDGLGDDYYQEGDEDYSPYLVSYTTTTTYDMISALNETANVMNVITAKTGKTGRYGDPLAIAEQFGDYVCGVSTYVLSELENQGLEKKTVAVVQNINSDGTFTLADAASQDATSTVRGVEYVALVSDNIAAEVGTTGVTGEQLLTADVVIISGSNGGGSDDTALPNTEEGLIAALEVSGYDETDIEDMMVITSNPDSIYGITMNSIENGMGFGYFIGYMYSDMLDIDPVEMCAYFYEQFYHVSDFDSLQSITNTTYSDVTLPEGMSTDLSDYNTDEINEKLAQGKEYYYDNFSDFAETALTTVWPEDQSGIAAGSSKNYTSVDSSGLKLSALASAMADSDTITAKADSYTEDSYADYEAALTNAQTVMNNSSYFTQSEVNSIRAALVSAKNALVEETVETVAGDTIGIRSGNTFYLYEQLGDTVYSVELDYGRSTDEILIGDWNGDGLDTLCRRRDNAYYFQEYISDSTVNYFYSTTFGRADDEVFAGKWSTAEETTSEESTSEEAASEEA